MSDTTHWDWQSAYPAPAKLNLFLHITGRRPDGYHLLQTLFRFVDHGDTLYFSPRDDASIYLRTPLPGVAPENDLTVRAARLLQQETGCRQGVDIRLEKHLPMGGGLGGGSSDAATVLLALNHLWQLGLPRQRLQQLGLTLGADVPVFVFGQNAFAEGVGENLQSIDLPTARYLVLEPPVHVPTAAVFSAPDLKRNTPAIRIADWHPGFGGNDLEIVARSRYPLVGEYLDWLKRAAAPYNAVVHMSGSGACVFAEFSVSGEISPELASQAVFEAIPAGWKGWLADGLTQHPLASLGF